MIATYQQPNRRAIRPWQQTILAGYALLFAFVLPFLCFGAVVTPGHPHGHAHFVFSIPKTAHTHPAQAIDADEILPDSDEQSDTTGTPPFKSTPDLLSFALLLLLLSAPAIVAFVPVAVCRRRLAELLPNPPGLAPATPPPEPC